MGLLGSSDPVKQEEKMLAKGEYPPASVVVDLGMLSS